MRTSIRVVLLSAMGLTACGHSEPFATGSVLTAVPFTPGSPARLTYDEGITQRARFSEDGRYLVYSLPDPDRTLSDHDHDYCLGVLPSTGGQRVATVCLPSEEDRFRRDGIEHGALSADGQLAFVRHSGIASSGSSLEGALFTTHMDSLAGVRQRFVLKRTPEGARGRWDYLLDMTWEGPHRLVALAARADLVPRFPGAPPDTLYTGLEIVRFDMSSDPLTWEHLFDADGARGMAWDPERQHAILLRHDSLFEAGSGALRYALAERSEWFGEIAGIAFGGGKLWVLEQYGTSGGRAGGSSAILAEHTLQEIDGGGRATPRVRETTLTFPGTRWRRLTISPDGRSAAWEQSTPEHWGIHLRSLAQ